MIDLGQILVGLVQRTTEGKLKWSSSVENDRFVTSVDAISIVIVEYEGDWGKPRYRLDILDAWGELADSFDFRDTTPEQVFQLERLFVLARRSANDIDSTLEKLARALELP
jgi:hypothetical protein